MRMVKEIISGYNLKNKEIKVGEFYALLKYCLNGMLTDILLE
jgi:hypothetical protein